MKKIAAFILAICMIFALCSCAGTGSTAPANDAAQANEPAEAETLPETAGNDLGEPVELTVICGFPDGDMASDMLIYLCDLIEERSAGNITFKRYMGGTFCTIPEEYGYIASGAADLNMLLCGFAVEEMPMWNIAGYDIGAEAAVAQFHYIYMENEETATAAAAEAAAAGIKVLGTLTGGLNVDAARNKEITCLADMEGLAFGVDRGANVYSALGLNAMATVAEDTYESLSRGVIDSTNSGISSFYANKWYEVAPYILISNAVSAGPFISMNFDRWNSLTEAQQTLIQECVADTEAYTMEYVKGFADNIIQEMEASGCTINYMPEEDDLRYLQTQLEINAADDRSFAEAMGDAEAFDTLVAATMDYLTQN